MNLDELDRILHAKNAALNDRRNISLSDLAISMLDSISSNRSDTVRTAIYNLYTGQFAVVKVVNTINNRVLYIVCRTIDYYRKDWLHIYLNTDQRLCIDIREHSLYCLDVEIIGVFKTSVLALDYKDYSINKDLNNGIVLYNNEVYSGAVTRVLHMHIDDNLLYKFVLICSAKKKSVGGLLLRFINKVVDNNIAIIDKDSDYG